MESVELACVIARRDFGPAGGAVARELLLRPGLRLLELYIRCRPLGLSARTVDDCLAVLLNHGIAYAEGRAPVGANAEGKTPAEQRALNGLDSKILKHDETEQLFPSQSKLASVKLSKGEPLLKEEDQIKPVGRRTRARDPAFIIPPNTVLTYYVNMKQLLLRTRNGPYARLALLLHGDEGLKITRLLLERGRLTASAILQAAFIAQGATESELDAAEARLIVMVKSGFLRWAGSGDAGPVSANVVRFTDESLEANSAPTSQQEPSACDDHLSSSDDPEALSSSKPGYATASDKEQLLTPAELDDMDPAYNQRTGRVRVGLGPSAKFVNAPLRTNNTDAWMVYTFRLNTIFRNHCCVEVVRGLLSLDREESRALLPKKVFQAGLNFAMRAENIVSEDQSFSETEEIDIGDIREELERGGLEISEFDFARSIQTLLRIRPEVAFGLPEDAPARLVFRTGLLVSFARQQTMEDTLLEKHSRTGLRLWRCLAVHGCLPEKMLSDMAMLNGKVAREHLYKLASDGFLTVQEVPKSNEPVRPDRPTPSWYLWRADVGAVYRRMLADALSATRRVMLKCEELRAGHVPDEPHAERKWANAIRLLEATVFRCDTLVMLFRDFGDISVDSFRTLYKTPADIGKAPKVPMF